MYCYDITDAQVVHPSGILTNLITLYQRAGTVQVFVSHTRTQSPAAIVQSILTISTHRHPLRGCNTLPIQSFSDLEDWWGRVQQKVHGRLNGRRPPNSQQPCYHTTWKPPCQIAWDPFLIPPDPTPTHPRKSLRTASLRARDPYFTSLATKLTSRRSGKCRRRLTQIGYARRSWVVASSSARGAVRNETLHASRERRYFQV